MASGKQNIPDISFVRAETNLFEDISYDVTIQNTSHATYYPMHSVESKTSPIQFNITGNDINYLNLAESKLYIRARIVDKNGKKIAYEADKNKSAYAPVNNFLHSMFKNVTLHVNDVEVTPMSGYYGYRAYIETLLAKGKDYKKSQGQACMYYKTKNEGSTDDEGWRKRMELCDRSETFEMFGRPHLDLMQQAKLIPPGVDVKITFYRADDAFSIQSVGTQPVNDLQIEILEAEFHVTKHTLLPSLMVGQLKKWESGHPAVFPMREIQMKSYTLPVGTISHHNENTISGFLPDRIVIAMVDAKDIHGEYATNPLIFEDFGLANISVTCNSEEVSQFNMDLDFANKRYVRAYSAVFEGLGLSDCDSGIELTMSEFQNGKTLFVYDLRHLRDAFCPPRHGNCMISLKFKSQLAKAVTVLCYLEYQSVLNINSDRQVYFRDYSKHY